MASIESIPTGSVEVINVAVLVKPGPGTSVTAPSISAVVVGGNNSTKLTVPVGAAKLPVSVAMRVTGRPAGEGFGAPISVASVVSGDTVIVTEGDIDGVCV